MEEKPIAQGIEATSFFFVLGKAEAKIRSAFQQTGKAIVPTEKREWREKYPMESYAQKKSTQKFELIFK